MPFPIVPQATLPCASSSANYFCGSTSAFRTRYWLRQRGLPMGSEALSPFSFDFRENKFVSLSSISLCIFYHTLHAGRPCLICMGLQRNLAAPSAEDIDRVNPWILILDLLEAQVRICRACSPQTNIEKHVSICFLDGSTGIELGQGFAACDATSARFDSWSLGIQSPASSWSLKASNTSLQNCHLGPSCAIAMAWSIWAAYNFTYQFAKNLRWKDSCFISSSRWTCSVQCPWLRVPYPSDSTELLSIHTLQWFPLFHHELCLCSNDWGPYWFKRKMVEPE